MRYFVLTDQGSREYMEDRHVASKVGYSSHVAAVFDGHGGDEVSEYSSNNFAQFLAKTLDAAGGGKDGGAAAAMKTCIDHFDDVAKGYLRGSSAGTTLCAVLIQPKAIVTANVGDSRAVLFSKRGGGTTYELSRDHKPSDKAEEDRILRHGGFVTQPHQTDGVHRVMGRLSLSRALGDWELRPWVSSSADITVHDRTRDDEFVVIATDGVWDVMSSDEVTTAMKRMFSSGMRPQTAMQNVLMECRRRGSGDNITILLVDVNRVL